MMPLTMTKAGETVTIRRISGKDEVRLHLAELGFVVGSEVTVVNEIAGNLIVQVKQSRLALDKTATVARLHGEGPVKRRIMDMGITKGVQIYVRKVAPLGDPMELTVRNYELSVRKADAEMIEVV